MKKKKVYKYVGETITTPFLYPIQEVELQYLYPEKKLLGASGRARRTRGRLWSVDDGTLRYFKLFPRPVSAASAFKDFMRDAVYADIPEGEVVEVFPVGFEVQAWDARYLRREDGLLEDLREWTEHSPLPYDRKVLPKTTFVGAVWMP